jgi:hypothetical protein
VLLWDLNGIVVERNWCYCGILMVLLWSVICVIVGCFSYLLQLFSRLTVEEHLGFYARLKGMSSHLVDGEVDR